MSLTRALYGLTRALNEANAVSRVPKAARRMGARVIGRAVR